MNMVVEIPSAIPILIGLFLVASFPFTYVCTWLASEDDYGVPTGEIVARRDRLGRLMYAELMGLAVGICLILAVTS